MIVGAWFKNMQTAYLSSAGMFGPRVDRSQEFHRAEQVGTLRALTVPYPHRDATYSLMITESGGILLYNNFDSEQEELSLVLSVKALLDECWRG